jgi:hypothetical protein
MAQPNIRPGTKVGLPAQFFVSAGSGQMIALPGVSNIEVKNTIDPVEDTDAPNLQKGDRAGYQKYTGKATITGKTVDFLAWCNGYTASTSTDTFCVVEDIAVTAGVGALGHTPFTETGGLETVALWDSNGDTLNQVTGTPGAGEYSVVGTVLTVGGSPTATYTASYLASTTTGTPTGTKFELDLTNRPPRCCEVWMGGYTIDPSTGCGYASDKAEVLVLKNVVFTGEMPIFTAQLEEKSYDVNFTANIWARDDLTHYMPQEPEA